MYRRLLTGGLCLALGACATTSPQTLPKCDGQHRRPANPNGSVLLVPAMVGKPGAPAAAAPPAASGPSFAPCGDRS